MKHANYPFHAFRFEESSSFSKCHKYPYEHLQDKVKDIINRSPLINGCTLEDTQLDRLVSEIGEISRKLFLSTSCSDAELEFKVKLRKLTSSYSCVMEEFSPKLYEWSELRERNIHIFQKVLQTFYYLKRTFTGVTLVTSTLEFLWGLGGLFGVNLNPKCTSLVHLAGGLSIGFSLSTFLYSNEIIQFVLDEVREETFLMRDLEVTYRKGNWIDKDVQDLFPHGVDLDLVKKLVFSDSGNPVPSWKQQVCTAVILSNVNKDKKLLNDDKFLASAKEFAESTAAQIWINRMKLRDLLDDVTRKLEDLPHKKSIKGNEAFLHLFAINIYPVFLSLLCNLAKLKETKFLFTSITAVASARSFHPSSKRDGFEAMNATSRELQDDYKHIRSTIKNLITDYD